MIIVTGFPFSVLVAQLMVTFLSLLRVFVVYEHFHSEAESLFQDLGVCIVSGHRYLGGFIGDLNQRNAFVQMKANNWVKHVCVFSDIAAAQPQLAYVTVARSLQHKWTLYFLDCGALFQNLEIALASSFFPVIIGDEVSSVEHDLLSLPLQMEGLGISNPMSTASHCYSLSTHSTTSLVTFVIRASVFELDTHTAPVSLAKDHYRACFNDYFILNLILCSHYMIFSNNVLCYMLKSFIIWLVVTITLCTRSVDLSPQ